MGCNHPHVLQEPFSEGPACPQGKLGWERMRQGVGKENTLMVKLHFLFESERHLAGETSKALQKHF